MRFEIATWLPVAGVVPRTRFYWLRTDETQRTVRLAKREVRGTRRDRANFTEIGLITIRKQTSSQCEYYSKNTFLIRAYGCITVCRHWKCSLWLWYKWVFIISVPYNLNHHKYLEDISDVTTTIKPYKCFCVSEITLTQCSLICTQHA